MRQYIPFFETNETYEGRRGSGVFEPQTDYILSEKLYRLQSDVELIYNRAFKKFVDDYDSGVLKSLASYMSDPIQGDFCEINSSELKSKVCKEAHSENPIKIYCGVYGASLYDFTKGRDRYLLISLNKGIIDIIYNRNTYNDRLIDISFYKNANNSKSRRTLNEITSFRIKSSIAHELTHWVDDSRYKIFSRMVGDETDPIKTTELLKLGKGNIDFTYFEIQSQIHGIAQLKKSSGSEWDLMTINDVFERYTALSGIIETIYKSHNIQIADIWVRAIIRRMGREGLLGKNMKKSLDTLSLMDVKKIISESIHPYRV